MEDPTLQRAFSHTGFTHQEELAAFSGDLLGSLIDLQMRAHFEEPSGGWPDPVHIIRPKQEKSTRREDPKTRETEVADWRKLVDFTNAIHRENHGE